MKMQDSLKRAGYLFLALVLFLSALPAKGEETGQSQSSSEESGQKPQAEAKESAKSSQDPAAAAASSPNANVIVPPESTTPPRNLKKVGNHWTPYQPPDPESFPEGAQVHIIVPGDTLWGMAGAHFQNPYLWPQIWNENRYILDSHWIYPGDPLLLPPRPTVVSEIAPATGETGGPALPPPAPEEGSGEAAEEAPPAEPMMPETASAPEGPGPAADHSDVYCTGEVRRDYKKTDLYIANSEEEKIGLYTGDLVYLNGGKDGNKVHPGDTFLVIAKGNEVFHPVTDNWVGTYVRRLGRVKVLAVQDRTSIAEITESCQDRIEVGFELEPDREITVPPARDVTFHRLDVEPSGKPNGYIVHLQDELDGAVTGSMVDVDLGSRDGVKPGDVLLIYLNNKAPKER
ncbi:MAG TPA: LysM peptidoglycan-binding domain-containing protein, partial [Candidatus Polarisedimenticolia bacterium]|nr:LysM peptidoglycan-binding domain-containing protein [Candidatus Polarisedimenticolia bacterium]